MGDEVAKADFAPADFDAFAARLAAEIADLGRMWNDGAFADSGFSIGCEIEAWLLDHAYYPAPVNQAFLAKADHPLVVPELSRFNIELNCTPLPLAGDVFARMAAELTGLWAHCETVAHGLDANAVLIGTLPVIRNADLSLANISPLKRYAALNREILRRRDGRPVRVEISGREALAVEHRDVMLEAATTSFQVHLKVPAARAHLYWNASAMAAGPLLAAAGNAPFLFGRDLWDETRIPLFEQAIDLGDGQRLGQRAALPRRTDPVRGIFLDDAVRCEELEQLSDRRKLPCARGRRKAGLRKRMHVGCDVVRACLRERPRAPDKKSAKALEIAAVGLGHGEQSVGRGDRLVAVDRAQRVDPVDYHLAERDLRRLAGHDEPAAGGGPEARIGPAQRPRAPGFMRPRGSSRPLSWRTRSRTSGRRVAR